jgi:gamma-glutamyl-gamma-aminobutyrate hydrolase PuuD
VSRPLIGVSCGSAAVPIPEGSLDSHYVGRAYTRAVVAAGGLPVVLPAVDGDEERAAGELVARLDGLVLAGGTDIMPATYGRDFPMVQKADPARDRFEVALVRAADAAGLPVLGVCRGMELLNVARGGTLHEHVVHEVEATTHGTLQGVNVHELDLEPGSLAAEAYGRTSVTVLCMHHQAPDAIGEDLEVCARSRDGMVEGLQDRRDGRFALGLLWHPEHHISDEPLQLRPYEAVVRAAAARAFGTSPGR